MADGSGEIRWEDEKWEFGFEFAFEFEFEFEFQGVLCGEGKRSCPGFG